MIGRRGENRNERIFVVLQMKYHISVTIDITIKGGSRRAEKSCKVLMLMKAAKLGWAGAGAEKKQGWTKTRARKGRSRN